MIRVPILLLTILAPVPSQASKGVTASSCERNAAGEPGVCGAQRQARTLLQHTADSMLGHAPRSSARAPLTLRQVDRADENAKDAQTPGGRLDQYIKGQLLPSEEATKNELQSEVNRVAGDFDVCATDMRSSQDSLREQEATLATAEQRHSECEMKVAMGNRTEVEVCGDMEKYATDLEAPVDLQTINGSDVTALVEALGQMNDYFNSVYPQMQEKRKKCDVAKSEEKVTQEQCDADKRSIEQSWCSLKANRVQTCDSFDTCFSGKDKRFDQMIKYVEKLEQNSKDNFKTLACHGDPNCNPGESDTSHLSISYPPKPTKMTCDRDVRSDWDYSAVSCGGDSIDVTSVTEESSAPSDSTSNGTAL